MFAPIPRTMPSSVRLHFRPIVQTAKLLQVPFDRHQLRTTHSLQALYESTHSMTNSQQLFQEVQTTPGAF